jgi:5'-nucleotidase
LRILVTNDDGIEAEGLQQLAAELAEWADVIVAAPSAERSASGHSITLTRPVYAEPYRRGRVSGWSVDGTPADCVKLAVEVLLEDRPDLVVSGINHGSNLGRDVFYSGTVSAAIEACFLGLCGVAVSQARPNPANLAWAAKFVRWWLETSFVLPPPGVIYNVNLPPFEDLSAAPRELVPAVLGRRVYRNQFRPETSPDGRPGWRLGGTPLVDDEEPRSDVAVVARGQAAITPLKLEITADDVLDRLRPVSLSIPRAGEAMLPKRGGGAHRQ